MGRCGTQGHDLVGALAVLCLWLDSTILSVFSNPNDSMKIMLIYLGSQHLKMV